jgi:Tol biopolymer transport system component
LTFIVQIENVLDPRSSRLAVAAALLTLVFSASGCAHGGARSGNGVSPARNGEILFNGYGRLYLMRPDGTHQRPFTRAPHDVGEVTWSPDGKRIAFSRARTPSGECPQLYVMRADGSHIRRLRHDGWCYGYPAWSPDGRRLAFER